MVHDFTVFPLRSHGAGAAVAGVAAHVCSREAQLLADKVHQQQPGLGRNFALRAVDLELDQFLLCHAANPPLLLLPARSAARASARLVSSLIRPVL